MERVSEHFTVDEWSCNCGCGMLKVRKKLVVMAESFRAYLCEKYKKDVRLDVHCVGRCKKHNASLARIECIDCGKVMRYFTNRCTCGSRNLVSRGSSPRSLHLRSMAMDCHSLDIGSGEFLESAGECHDNGILYGGLGYYHRWNNPGIHFDIAKFRSWGDGRYYEKTK